jgi:glycosyltransferase involved in cell wall biosynthesis
MQHAGFDVSYVNLVEEMDEIFFRYLFGDNFDNPQSLANVHTCILKNPLWRAHDNLTELIHLLAPNLLVGFGFIAARLLELATPDRPVVFMPAGVRHLQYLLESGVVKDFMAFQASARRGITFPVSARDRERLAVGASALIIVHSPLAKFAFEHLFPAQRGKIYDNIISVADLIYAEAEPFHVLKRPFAQRDIDLIFVASSWNRPEKNYQLVRQLISRCAGLNIHIVGDIAHPHPAAHYHGAVTQRHELYALLGRSKTLVCPSLIDAAPGILFEASAMGCNVIASPNCGNWQLCHEQLLAEHCSPKAFLQKILLSLTRLYQDNPEHFRGGYADLVETLEVFEP